MPEGGGWFHRSRSAALLRGLVDEAGQSRKTCASVVLVFPSEWSPAHAQIATTLDPRIP